MRHLQRSELRYPGLWRQCVGAWTPCLGPTGLMLRDWSGYKNHGTLTNMDPPTDWVLSGSGYALNFDGTNDTISTASRGVSAAPRTVCAWFRTSRSLSSGQYMGIVGFGSNSTGAAFFFGFGNDPQFGATGFGVSQFGDAVGSTGYNNGIWNHGCVVNVGTLWSVYVNGVFVTSKTMTTNSGSNNTVTIGSWTLATALGSSANFDGDIDDVRIYSRAVTEQEIRLLSRRRGIAYETFRRRRSVQVIASSRRRRLLLLGQE